MSSTPPKGQYHPASPTDLRAPCPVLNSLANHGLISRSGRSITSTELTAALRYLGLGATVTSLLVNTSFKVHSDDTEPNPPPGTSGFGLRDSSQTNPSGIPILNLDQVGRPHAIEHDVSLTREDRALGDCIRLNADLYEQMLSCARHEGDGAWFHVKDLGRFRKRRYVDQTRRNDQLVFDKKRHYVACAEAAGVQAVFGQGMSGKVPREYMEAVFSDERLPFDEGWRPRRWKIWVPEVVVRVLAVSWFAWPF